MILYNHYCSGIRVIIITPHLYALYVYRYFKLQNIIQTGRVKVRHWFVDVSHPTSVFIDQNNSSSTDAFPTT